ncbi:MAG: hypothetical protein HUK08_06820 [Bacteroidaceae bacterium]|nr:hypothetical protein [Bacteroidaceae bacterium]
MKDSITLSIYGNRTLTLNETDSNTQKDTTNILSFTSLIEFGDNDSKPKVTSDGSNSFTEIKLKGGTAITVGSFKVRKQLFSPNYIEVTLKGATDNRSLATIDNLKDFLAKSTVNLTCSNTSVLKNYFVFSAKVEKYNDKEFELAFTAYSADKFLTLPTTNQSYTNRSITDIADYFVNTKYQTDLDRMFSSYGNETYDNKTSLSRELLLILNKNQNRFQHLSERDTTKMGAYKADRFLSSTIQSRESAYDFLSRLCYENGEYFFYEDSQMRFGSGHYYDGLINSLALKNKDFNYSTGGQDIKEKIDFKDITGCFEEEKPMLFANSAYIKKYNGDNNPDSTPEPDPEPKSESEPDTMPEPEPEPVEEDKTITLFFGKELERLKLNEYGKPIIHNPEADTPVKDYEIFKDCVKIYDYDLNKRNTSGELHIKMRFKAGGTWPERENGMYGKIDCKVPEGFVIKKVEGPGTAETKDQKHGFNPSVFRINGNPSYIQLDLILTGEPKPAPKPTPKPTPQPTPVPPRKPESVDPSNPEYEVYFKSGEKGTSIEAASIMAKTEKELYSAKGEKSFKFDESYAANAASSVFTGAKTWISKVIKILNSYRIKKTAISLSSQMTIGLTNTLLNAHVLGTAKDFEDNKKKQEMKYKTARNYSIEEYGALENIEGINVDNGLEASKHEEVSRPKSPRTKPDTPVNALSWNKYAHATMITLKAQNQYWGIGLGYYFLYRQTFRDATNKRGIFCANSVSFDYDGNGYSMTIQATRRASVEVNTDSQTGKATQFSNEEPKDLKIIWCPGIIPPFMSESTGTNGAPNNRQIMPYGQNPMVNNSLRLATVWATYGTGEGLSALGQKFDECEGMTYDEDTKKLTKNEEGTSANADPLALGRVRVVFDDDEMQIPSELMPVAKPADGFYFTPRVGDRVLVAYAYGNPNKPFVLCDMGGNKKFGSSYSEKNGIVSRNGHKITFDDPIGGNSVTDLLTSLLPIPLLSELISNNVSGPSGKWVWKQGGITLTDDLGIYKISMDSGDRSVKVSSPIGDVEVNALTGIKIAAPKGDIDIQGYNVNITAGNNVNITSGKAIGENPLPKNKDDWKKIGMAYASEVVGQFVDFDAWRFLFRLVFQPVEGSISLNSPRNILISNGDRLDFKDVDNGIRKGKDLIESHEKLATLAVYLTSHDHTKVTQELGTLENDVITQMNNVKNIINTFKQSCCINGENLLADSFWSGIVDNNKLDISTIFKADGSFNKDATLSKKLECKDCDSNPQQPVYTAEFNGFLKNPETDNDKKKKVHNAAKTAYDQLRTLAVELIFKKIDIDFLNTKLPADHNFDKGTLKDYIEAYTSKGYVLNDDVRKKPDLGNNPPTRFSPENFTNNNNNNANGVFVACRDKIKALFELKDSDLELVKKKNGFTDNSFDDNNNPKAKANKKKYLAKLIDYGLSKTTIMENILSLIGADDLMETINDAKDNKSDWRLNQGPFGVYMGKKAAERTKFFKNHFKPRIYFGTDDSTWQITEKGFEKDDISKQSKLNRIDDFLNSLPNL